MAGRRNDKQGASTASIIAVAVLLVVVVWYTGLADRIVSFVELPGQSSASRTIQKNGDLALGAGEVSADARHGYVYEHLSDADKALYESLYEAFVTRQEQGCDKTDSAKLGTIRDCVLADHPEIFYANGAELYTTTRMGIVVSMHVSGTFTYSPEDAQVAAERLEAAASECIAGIDADADDYAKAKYLYEYIAEHVQYDHAAAASSEAESAYAGQTAVDALVDGRAVCGGYSRAYQYLLEKVGIECVYVSGRVDSQGHAWCAAQLDGEWYYIDPTWGDSEFVEYNGAKYSFDFVNYDYFCVTQSDLATSHTAQSSYPLPSCTSMNDNYYVREGAYFEGVDLSRAAELVRRALSGGGSTVRLRCADANTYAQMLDSLITDGGIYRMYSGKSCQYFTDDGLYTITVLLG